MESTVYLRDHLPRKSSFQWMLVLSIGIHIFFFLLRWSINNPLNSPFDVSKNKESLIELSPIPPQTQPRTAQRRLPLENQIVETEDAGNRLLDPNASLLSDRNQTASQQTRAAKTDDFSKGAGKGIVAQPQASTVSPGILESDPLSISEGKTNNEKKHWSNLSLKDLSLSGDGKPLSASDDYLPGVAAGERTILSTREFKYFSYYNRIKDLLRQFWKPSIEREVSKLWGKGQMLRETELVTRVLVLLDEKGQIHKISKLGASGVVEIDEIAVKAFHAAAPFPNPPSALIESDGFVRLKWDFILQTSAAPRIQYSPRAPTGLR